MLCLLDPDVCVQAGYRCLGMCEIDTYCQAVLRKHFPGIPIHGDINTLDLCSVLPHSVDFVVLSTPCVDVSVQGSRMAQLGAESPLFFVAVKKVAALGAIHGWLPCLVSENVTGRRFLTWDSATVRLLQGIVAVNTNCITCSHQHRLIVMTSAVCMQNRYRKPFMKVEIEVVLGCGWTDLGWRDVCAESFGLPNPKCHTVLVATDARHKGLVDRMLFSRVRLTTAHLVSCP